MNLDVKDHIDYVMLVLTILLSLVSNKQTVNVPEGGNTDATHCYVCLYICFV